MAVCKEKTLSRNLMRGPSEPVLSNPSRIVQALQAKPRKTRAAVLLTPERRRWRSLLCRGDRVIAAGMSQQM